MKNTNESAHTPGPWRVSAGLIVADGHAVASYSGGPESTINYDTRHTDANARLIASAPAMLDALRLVMPRLLELDKLTHRPGEGETSAGLAAIAVRVAIAQAVGDKMKNSGKSAYRYEVIGGEGEQGGHIAYSNSMRHALAISNRINANPPRWARVDVLAPNGQYQRADYADCHAIAQVEGVSIHAPVRGATPLHNRMEER